MIIDRQEIDEIYEEQDEYSSVVKTETLHCTFAAACLGKMNDIIIYRAYWLEDQFIVTRNRVFGDNYDDDELNESNSEFRPI